MLNWRNRALALSERNQDLEEEVDDLLLRLTSLTAATASLVGSLDMFCEANPTFDFVGHAAARRAVERHGCSDA